MNIFEKKIRKFLINIPPYDRELRNKISLRKVLFLKICKNIDTEQTLLPFINKADKYVSILPDEINWMLAYSILFKDWKNKEVINILNFVKQVVEKIIKNEPFIVGINIHSSEKRFYILSFKNGNFQKEDNEEQAPPVIDIKYQFPPEVDYIILPDTKETREEHLIKCDFCDKLIIEDIAIQSFLHRDDWDTEGIECFFCSEDCYDGFASDFSHCSECGRIIDNMHGKILEDGNIYCEACFVKNSIRFGNLLKEYQELWNNPKTSEFKSPFDYLEVYKTDFFLKKEVEKYNHVNPEEKWILTVEKAIEWRESEEAERINEFINNIIEKWGSDYSFLGFFSTNDVFLLYRRKNKKPKKTS